jgi:hypothetical protein
MLTEAYEKWWEMNDALIGYEEYVKRLGVNGTTGSVCGLLGQMAS